MKPLIILLLIAPQYVFCIVNMFVGVQSPCDSIVDCLSSDHPNTICIDGFCVPCRNSSEPCSSSSHCCGGSRCYRHQCTSLHPTGQPCRLHRECSHNDDFCVNRICTRCIPVFQPCSSDSLATPCCVGRGICRNGICQPTKKIFERCSNTFDCADDLVCMSGTCQNPLGKC